MKGVKVATVVTVGLALLAFGLFVTQTFGPSLSRQSHGFAAYYTGAWLLQHGRQDILYDAPRFSAAIPETGISGIQDLYDSNAPLFTGLTWWLAFWPPQTARVVWLWLNLGLLAITVGLLSRLLGKPGLLTISFVAAACLFYAPLGENFRLAQTYMPFLLAACLTVLVGRPWGGAVGVGLELAVKLYYGLFGLVVGLTRWRTTLTGVGLTALAALLLLPWFGISAWLNYFQVASSFSQRPFIGVTAYQTFAGLFSHLFHYEAQWNPTPVANLPFLAEAGPILMSLLVVIPTIWLVWRQLGPRWQLGREATLLVIAIALDLSPLIAPIAEEYHFTILLLPLFVSLRSLLEAGRPLSSLRDLAGRLLAKKYAVIGWLLAVLLLALPWAYKSWPKAGWKALASYPRLYGALILWAVLFWQLNRLRGKDAD